ncbi:MAG: ABC transporter permease [Chloroflexota bacterium]
MAITVASRRLRIGFGAQPLSLVCAIVALLLAVPVLTVVASLLVPPDSVMSHVVATVLPRYITNTLGLIGGVGAGVLILGVGTAWLVTMCRFPTSRVCEWAMLMPMAVPAYLLAYTYTSWLDVGGPVQAWIRVTFQVSVRNYWFPQVRSLEGAVVMLTLALFPYVYLLARAAFLEQSVCALEVSRTLGYGPWASFRRVALPLARPSIVAGLSLALMETLADFGTVQYFGLDTFTTGIFRSWYGMDSKATAAQLSAVLLLLVAGIIVMERWSRGRAKYHHTSSRYSTLRPYRLTGLKALGASLFCWLPILLGFILPAGLLIKMTQSGGDQLFGANFLRFVSNSLVLAGIACLVAVVLATILAYTLRLHPGGLARFAATVGTMGYAVPGSIIAVGVLLTLGRFDNALDGWVRTTLGVSTGLLLSGTGFALIYAYQARFLAVAFNAVEASLSKIKPGFDDAARTLGTTPFGTLQRVHTPLMRGSLFTAMLMVFVDVIKELPATIIVRPFNFDTLAVRVYQLASDERLTEASTAALAIVIAGTVPVIVLSRAIARARPGEVNG